MSHIAEVVSIVPGLDDERKAAFITQCLKTLNVVLKADERAWLEDGATAVAACFAYGKIDVDGIREKLDRFFGPGAVDPPVGRDRVFMLVYWLEVALNVMTSIGDAIRDCNKHCKKVTWAVEGLNGDLMLKIGRCVAAYAADKSMVCDLARLEEPVTVRFVMGTLCEDIEALLRVEDSSIFGGSSLTEAVLATVEVGGIKDTILGMFGGLGAGVQEAAGVELD